MDLSLSVSPEAASGDWQPAAGAAPADASGAAFGDVLGDAVAVDVPAPVEAITRQGVPRGFDATAWLSFTGAPAAAATPEGPLVNDVFAAAAETDDALVVAGAFEASDDLDEALTDDVPGAVVVAPALPEAVSALPWGMPVAVVSAPTDASANATLEATSADALTGDGSSLPTQARVMGMPSTGAGLATLDAANSGATNAASLMPSAETDLAAVSAAADALATTDPPVIAQAREGESAVSDLLTGATDAQADAANQFRKKSGAAADPMASVWTAASPAARADVLRSLMGQTSSAEASESPVADLAAALTRREAGTPRAALMLAQALRPLEMTPVAPGGAERLESVLASRQLDAVMDAELPSQLIDAIRLQARSGVQEARIRLRPEVLGEVSIAISVAGGAVSATIEAESPAVRQWIERHEGMLRERLSDQGLQLAQLEVKADDRQRDSERQRREQRDAQKPVVMTRAQREAAARRFAAML